jgi:hypothetical protein
MSDVRGKSATAMSLRLLEGVGRLCRAERPSRALHGCCNRLANWDRQGVTGRKLMR